MREVSTYKIVYNWQALNLQVGVGLGEDEIGWFSKFVELSVQYVLLLSQTASIAHDTRDVRKNLCHTCRVCRGCSVPNGVL